MKNIKYKNINIFFIYLVIILLAPKIAFALSSSLNQGIASVVMDTDSRVEIRFNNFAESISANTETNYIFKDADGNALNGTALGCTGINENGIPISVEYSNSYFNEGPTASIDLGCVSDNKSTLTFGATYKVCVKDIKSDGLDNAMEEECVDFNNELILKSARNFADNPYIIDVHTNGDLLSSQTNSATYILKDSNGTPLDGSTIDCYNSLGSLLVDSSGVITGSKSSNNGDISISMGCVLPKDQYKICISNLQDDYFSSISSDEKCVDFDPAPNLLSVGMYEGSDKAIKLVFDKEVYFNNGSYITLKDSDGNVLSNLNEGIGEDGHPKYVLRQYHGFADSGDAEPNAYADNDSVVDNYKTWILDYSYGSSIFYKHAFPVGEYQLCIDNLKAYDVSNNIYGVVPTIGQCLTLSVAEDVTGPYLDSISGGFEFNKSFLTYPNKIVLKFSEPLENTAINTSRYMIKDYDTNGDTNPDVTTWKRLSQISNISITFTNNNKDVNIVFPNSIKLLDNITDFVIGDINKADEYSVNDIYGNPFITEIDNSIYDILLVNKNIDISYPSYIKKISIKSATEIEIKFDRTISSISKDEFVIKNNANQTGMTPLSATINSSDHSVVLFTIPSGINNEFTVNDYGDNRKNIQLTTTANVAVSTDLYGWLFEPLKIFTASENVMFKNYLVKPYIKSIKRSFDQKQIYLEIGGGQISDASIEALANSVIIYQNIDGVEKTATGWDSYANDEYNIRTLTNGKINFSYSQDYNYDYNNDISYLHGFVGFVIDPNYPFYIKTIAGDANNNIVDVVDVNGIPIKANTVGIEDSSDDFYSTNNYLALEFEEGNNIDKDTYFELYFNKNMDMDSISLNKKWVSYVDSTGGYAYNTVTLCNSINDRCYIQKVKNGIAFDSLTNKITFPGTNIGEIYDQNGFFVKGGSYSTYSDLDIIYKPNTKVLTLIITDNLNVDIATGDTMKYVPGSALKSASGKSISLDYYKIPFLAQKR